MKRLKLQSLFFCFFFFFFSCEQASIHRKTPDNQNKHHETSDEDALVSVENQCGVDMMVTYRAADPTNTTTNLGPLSHNHSIWIPAGQKVAIAWNAANEKTDTPLGSLPSKIDDNFMEKDETTIKAFWLVPNYCPKVRSNDVPDFIKFLNTTYADPRIGHDPAPTFPKNGLTYTQNCLYGFSASSPEFSTKFELTKDGKENDYHSSLDISYVDGFTIPMSVTPFVTNDETSATCEPATSEKLLYPPLFLKEAGFSKSDVIRQSDLYVDACNYKIPGGMENFYDLNNEKFFQTPHGPLTVDTTLEQLHFTNYNQHMDYDNTKPRQNAVGCLAPQTRFAMDAEDSSEYAKETVSVENAIASQGTHGPTFYDSRLIQYVCPYNTRTLYYYFNHGSFPPGSPDEAEDWGNWNALLSQWDHTYGLSEFAVFPLNSGYDHPGETAFAQIVKGYLAHKFSQYSPEDLTAQLTDKKTAMEFIDRNNMAPEMCHWGPMGTHENKTFPWLTLVHENSLRTYSFSYDDNQGTLSCQSPTTRFRVTLCPGGPHVGP